MVYSGYPSNLRTQYPQTTPDLIEGLITQWDKVYTFANALGITARVATITPGVATQEVTTYRLLETVTGQVVTFTSTGTPTAITVSNGLRAAIALNPILNGLVTLNSTGSNTVVATARIASSAGTPFNFVDGGSTPTNQLSVVTNAAADAGVLPFGRGLAGGADGKIGLASAALSGSNIFRGITGFTHADLTDIPGVADGYRSQDACMRLIRGQIAVRVVDAVTPVSPVYLVYAAGDNRGRFRGSADAGNASLISSGVAFNAIAPAGGLALLDINLPA